MGDPIFQEQILIVTAASIEAMNIKHRAQFGEDAIVAPWDPRPLAAEFAWLELADVEVDCDALAPRFAGSDADRHAAALAWAREKLDALRPGVSGELLGKPTA